MPDPSSGAARRRRWWAAVRGFAGRPWVRRTLTVLVLALCALFLVRSFAGAGTRAATGAALTRLSPALPVALIPAVAALWLTALSWREPLQALSVPLSRAAAVRIFAAGQLGRYVPGVMWSIVLQSRLAAASGITVLHLTVAFGAGAGVALSTGAVLGLPALAGYAYGTGAAVLAAALAPGALWFLPRVLTAAVRLLTALQALARRLAPVPRDVLRRSVWLYAAAWVVTGTHLWLLAVALGADPLAAVVPCVAGFTLATALASVVVVVPDGLGVREALLAVFLASVLPAPEAVVAAAASRLVLAAADVLAFAYGSLAVRRTGTKAEDTGPSAGPGLRSAPGSPGAPAPPPKADVSSSG